MQSSYRTSLMSILSFLTSLAHCASAGISTCALTPMMCADSGGGSHLNTAEKEGEKQGFSVLLVSCCTLSE